MTTVAMLVAACVLVWATVRASTATRRTPPTALPLPKEPVSIANSPAMGDPTAQVVVIEFSDFECPACQQFAMQMLPSFGKKWVDTARVQLIFKHAPINPSHQNAAPAAASASCAAGQGRFWPMHDRLFRAAGRLSAGDLRLHAGGVGLDLTLFDLCMEGAVSKQAIAADLRVAGSVGVRVTPTFFVGRRVEPAMVRITSILEGVPPDSVLETAFQVAERTSPTANIRP